MQIEISGYIVRLDDEDAHFLEEYKWGVVNCHGHRLRSCKGMAHMGRLVLGIVNGCNIYHINGDLLNFHKHNLTTTHPPVPAKKATCPFSKEEIKDLYFSQKLSLKDIRYVAGKARGDNTRPSHRLVQKWIIEYGFRLKTRSESKKELIVKMKNEGTGMFSEEHRTNAAWKTKERYVPILVGGKIVSLHPMFGKKHTVSAKRKMSKTRKGIKLPTDGRGVIPVVCENCLKEFTRTLSHLIKSNHHFCSRSCFSQFRLKNKPTDNLAGMPGAGQVLTECENCKIPIRRYPSNMKLSTFHYCGHICSSVATQRLKRKTKESE